MRRERLGLEISSLDARSHVEHGAALRSETSRPSSNCFAAFDFIVKGADTGRPDSCIESSMSFVRGYRDRKRVPGDEYNP